MPTRHSTPRLLIAYDGSESAVRAIQDVAKLLPGTTAVVLNVWKPLNNIAVYGPLAATTDTGEVNESSEADARALADEGAELARECGLNARSEAIMESGSVGDTITTRSLDDDIDMIVVGSTGHTALGGALFGSVSRDLTRHASVPLLLLRPNATATAAGTSTVATAGTQ